MHLNDSSSGLLFGRVSFQAKKMKEKCRDLFEKGEEYRMPQLCWCLSKSFKNSRCFFFGKKKKLSFLHPINFVVPKNLPKKTKNKEKKILKKNILVLPLRKLRGFWTMDHGPLVHACFLYIPKAHIELAITILFLCKSNFGPESGPHWSLR